MRCPHCHAEPPRDPFVCVSCGERLATYLGEPFGPGSGVPVAGAPGPQPDGLRQIGRGAASNSGGVLVLKILFGLCVGMLLLVGWPLMGAIYFLALALLLWSQRRMRLLTFLAVTVGLAIVFGLLGELADSSDLEDLFSPEPTPTIQQFGAGTPSSTPTLAPFQRNGTATAVAVQTRVYVNHARARWLRGDNVGAIAALRPAFEVSASQPDALNVRALVRISAGDPAAAVEDAVRAIDGEPSILAYRDTCGYAYLKAGRYADAAEQYSIVLGQARGDGRTASLLGRGLAYTALGRLSEARTDLQDGLRMAPDHEPDPQLLDLEATARRALDGLAGSPVPGSPAASPVVSPVASPGSTPGPAPTVVPVETPTAKPLSLTQMGRAS